MGVGGNAKSVRARTGVGEGVAQRVRTLFPSPL